MAEQLHKRFRDEQVKFFLERYVSRELKINYVLEILGIERRRFFKLLEQYRSNPDSFSVQYARKAVNRKIDEGTENNIIKELTIEKKFIENKEIPTRHYNYSYIKEELRRKYHQKVSLPTIISRAKKHNFYLPRPERKAHDRKVLTNYVGGVNSTRLLPSQMVSLRGREVVFNHQFGRPQPDDVIC